MSIRQPCFLCFQINDYLKSTFGADREFKIEEMTVRSGSYCCFRVEADLDLLNSLLDPQNWVEGVTVKKFRFFRKPFEPAGQRQ